MFTSLSSLPGVDESVMVCPDITVSEKHDADVGEKAPLSTRSVALNTLGFAEHLPFVIEALNCTLLLAARCVCCVVCACVCRAVLSACTELLPTGSGFLFFCVILTHSISLIQLVHF